MEPGVYNSFMFSLAHNARETLQAISTGLILCLAYLEGGGDIDTPDISALIISLCLLPVPDLGIRSQIGGAAMRLLDRACGSDAFLEVVIWVAGLDPNLNYEDHTNRIVCYTPDADPVRGSLADEQATWLTDLILNNTAMLPLSDSDLRSMARIESECAECPIPDVNDYDGQVEANGLSLRGVVWCIAHALSDSGDGVLLMDLRIAGIVTAMGNMITEAASFVMSHLPICLRLVKRHLSQIVLTSEVSPSGWGELAAFDPSVRNTVVTTYALDEARDPRYLTSLLEMTTRGGAPLFPPGGRVRLSEAVWSLSTGVSQSTFRRLIREPRLMSTPAHMLPGAHRATVHVVNVMPLEGSGSYTVMELLEHVCRAIPLIEGDAEFTGITLCPGAAPLPHVEVAKDAMSSDAPPNHPPSTVTEPSVRVTVYRDEPFRMALVWKLLMLLGLSGGLVWGVPMTDTGVLTTPGLSTDCSPASFQATIPLEFAPGMSCYSSTGVTNGSILANLMYAEVEHHICDWGPVKPEDCFKIATQMVANRHGLDVSSLRHNPFLASPSLAWSCDSGRYPRMVAFGEAVCDHLTSVGAGTLHCYELHVPPGVMPSATEYMDGDPTSPLNPSDVTGATSLPGLYTSCRSGAPHGPAGTTHGDGYGWSDILAGAQEANVPLKKVLFAPVTAVAHAIPAVEGPLTGETVVIYSLGNRVFNSSRDLYTLPVFGQTLTAQVGACNGLVAGYYPASTTLAAAAGASTVHVTLKEPYFVWADHMSTLVPTTLTEPSMFQICNGSLGPQIQLGSVVVSTISPHGLCRNSVCLRKTPSVTRRNIGDIAALITNVAESSSLALEAGALETGVLETSLNALAGAVGNVITSASTQALATTADAHRLQISTDVSHLKADLAALVGLAAAIRTGVPASTILTRRDVDCVITGCYPNGDLAPVNGTALCEGSSDLRVFAFGPSKPVLGATTAVTAPACVNRTLELGSATAEFGPAGNLSLSTLSDYAVHLMNGTLQYVNMLAAFTYYDVQDLVAEAENVQQDLQEQRLALEEEAAERDIITREIGKGTNHALSLLKGISYWGKLSAAEISADHFIHRMLVWALAVDRIVQFVYNRRNNRVSG